MPRTICFGRLGRFGRLGHVLAGLALLAVRVDELDDGIEQRTAVVIPDVGERERTGLQQQVAEHAGFPQRRCKRSERAEARAGEAAGGEFKQIKSAALLVVHEHSFPLVDLRVEFDRNPLAELRFLWEVYRPQVELYVTRAVDPDSIPYPET